MSLLRERVSMSYIGRIIVCFVIYVNISYGLNPLQNVSSPEFRALAEDTYHKVLPCVKSNPHLTDKNINFRFPDDAEAHYQLILEKTAPYRLAPIHEYAGYPGPWLENRFIAEFMQRPLFSFRGLIPLYIQWIDTQILRGRHFDYILSELNAVLRPDVLYVAVSQGDVGLGKIGVKHPNIFVLSAGGFGHIPLPLIKGELPYIPPPPVYARDIGFFGTIQQQHSTRENVLRLIEKEAHRWELTVQLGGGPKWKHDMEHSKFNLAPRGYGRNSFRFAETIQMGRIPVFLYDDVPWIPYFGSNISIETYGFVGGYQSAEHDLVAMVKQLHDLTPSQYELLIDKVQEVRPFFTYEGVMHQIALFFAHPFADTSYLRCHLPHPNTDRCCDKKFY